MEHNVTLSDIAKAANVSNGTVHRALYGKPGVSEIVRNEIKHLAEEMGYCPNALSSILKKKQWRIVIAFPKLEQDNKFFYSELWKGYWDFKNELKAYNLELIEVSYDDTQEKGFVANMKDVFRKYHGEIDGILTGGRIFKEGFEVIRRLVENKIPVVLVGEGISDCDYLSCIQTDYIIDGMLAAEILTSQISKEGKILVCAGDSVLQSNWKSMQGFERYIEKNQCSNEIIKIYGYERKDRVYDSVVKALNINRQIEGLYSVNLRCSLLLAKAVEELGLKGKIKLVGSDLCPEITEYIKKGIITNTIFKNPRYQGSTGAKRLTDYVLHNRMPDLKDEYNKSIVIFKSNVNQYL